VYEILTNPDGHGMESYIISRDDTEAHPRRFQKLASSHFPLIKNSQFDIQVGQKGTRGISSIVLIENGN
jgi:hypothetical protein